MLLYRIGRSLHARDLTGEGARLYGGRWNHPGLPCIYTSATRSLSLLEFACHAEMHMIPRALSFTTIEVPEDSIQIFSVAQLPGNWKHWPHVNETRDFGSELLKKSKYLVYGIPSVVIEEEMNYILNPRYQDARRIKIADVKDYAFDLRLKQ